MCGNNIRRTYYIKKPRHLNKREYKRRVVGEPKSRYIYTVIYLYTYTLLSLFITLRNSTNRELVSTCILLTTVIKISKELCVLEIQMVTMSSQCQAITDRYQHVQSQAERGHVACRNRSLIQGTP